MNREGKWVYDANAPSPGPQPPTSILPTVAPTGDVGDWIDPNAPDPTPDEVTDETDPNFVHPWFGDQ